MCVVGKTVGAHATGTSVMRALPKEVRARRAVGEGIGRGLREVYTEHKVEPLPDQARALLLRMEQATSHSRGRATRSGVEARRFWDPIDGGQIRDGLKGTIRFDWRA
jgi:hypothetical protein